MLNSKDFVFTDSLQQAFSDEYTGYCLHILCHAGAARFLIGDRLFNMVAGEIMIKSSPKRVERLECYSDLKIEALLISWDYLQKNSPQSGYKVTGHLSTIENPIFPARQTDIEQIHFDFQEIRNRLSKPYNNFYEDIVRREVEIMIFDFYDIHSRRNNIKVTGQSRSTDLLGRYVDLLQRGLFKENRRVDYYASLLFISPKYLSEACVSASGFNASYWIEYFTTDAIRHELCDTQKTLQQIADEYHFSSISYFSRYVKEHLHAAPSELRGRKD